MFQRAVVLLSGVLALLAQDLWPCQAASRPRNIVLIMTDQQFADAMSCRMGTRWLHTPVMDRLAAAGVLFTRAYTADPFCRPARASIFSGYYPHQTGVQTNGPLEEPFDYRRFRCMGIYLRHAGYDVAYSGKWHLWYKKSKPEQHGFEILKAQAGDNYDARVADAAVRFIRRPHRRPFLLVVSFLNPLTSANGPGVWRVANRN